MRFGSALVSALAIASTILFWPSALASAQGQSVTLNLTSQNNSGVTGTAVLTELPGGTLRVEIHANGAGPGPQPSHIHPGTCASLDPSPKFNLNTVVNGVSVTEVKGTLAELTASPFAIHMHKSPDELPVYVACADIKADAASTGQPRVLPTAGIGSVPSAWPSALLGGALVLLGLGLRRRAR